MIKTIPASFLEYHSLLFTIDYRSKVAIILMIYSIFKKKIMIKNKCNEWFHYHK